LAISFVDLERQLKAAVRTGKVTVGRKEVANSLKASKLLVWSASANLSQDLLNQCQSLQIPAVRFDGNPIELGHIAGIPYKVSILSVKSSGDAKLDPFSDSKDYTVHKLPSFLASREVPAETSEEEKEAETKKPSSKKGETKRKTRKKPGEEGEEPKTRKRAKKEEAGEVEEKKTRKTKDEKTAKPKAAKKSEKSTTTKKRKAKKEEEGADEEEADKDEEE
jgi:large subunit ribosomal protein L30e